MQYWKDYYQIFGVEKTVLGLTESSLSGYHDYATFVNSCYYYTVACYHVTVACHHVLHNKDTLFQSHCGAGNCTTLY